MNTWDEMRQDGFMLIDQQHKIAVKSVSIHDAAVEIIKEILIKSYIDYLIQRGKEEI